jgi:hypothetical protein
MEERLAAMEAKMNTQAQIIEDQQQIISRLKNPGIKSARDEQNKPKRIAEIEAEFTQEQAAERELRRYIRGQNEAGTRVIPTGPNKGKKIQAGYRKNLSPAKRERAKVLLDILGRKGLYWDENILDPVNHLPPEYGAGEEEE